MIEYVFVLLLMIPTFGGPVEMTFAFTTQDGCERFRRIVERKLPDEFSIDVQPGNARGHALRPEQGCQEREK